jgi:hypothetical protein
MHMQWGFRRRLRQGSRAGGNVDEMKEARDGEGDGAGWRR